MENSDDVLVIQHEIDCPPGNLADRATRAGVRLEVRRPFEGHELPATADGFAGLIVLGGERGAHDDQAWPWLPATRALIRAAVASQTPMLGICLGHQLAAVALGGDIVRMGSTIRGVRPFARTAQAGQDRLFAQLRAGSVTVQWNGDTVDPLPPGATVLARDADGHVQAARFGPCAWGMQSHPEVTAAIVNRWAHTSDAPEAQAAAEAAADVTRQLADIDHAWDAVLAEFFHVCRHRGDPACAPANHEL
ncbi:type 1 glutamine amidotransferase [Gephyromycinifex aptenodytis]|uniref:type 1 glutamine amidotransferase n=1 Tax=Gephyromycinifex aptenodytis TaxID=2716227 RepID=UPI0014455CF8|nr:type 1 glutamine amidotransferase [Gephyromycinifex aptenodytis]